MEPKSTRQLFWLISERRLRDITMRKKWKIYRVIDRDGFDVGLLLTPSVQSAFYTKSALNLYPVCSLHFIGTDCRPPEYTSQHME